MSVSVSLFLFPSYSFPHAHGYLYFTQHLRDEVVAELGFLIKACNEMTKWRLFGVKAHTFRCSHV
jgi:hypothetical protein